MIGISDWGLPLWPLTRSSGTLFIMVYRGIRYGCRSVLCALSMLVAAGSGSDVMAADGQDANRNPQPPPHSEEFKPLSGLDNTPRGGTLPGGTLPGGTLPGGTLPGGTLPGGTLPGGTLPGGTVPGGTLPGGSLPGGPVPGGTVAGGTLSGGPL